MDCHCNYCNYIAIILVSKGAQCVWEVSRGYN